VRRRGRAPPRAPPRVGSASEHEREGGGVDAVCPRGAPPPLGGGVAGGVRLVAEEEPAG
jgi:hypothetical protein